MPFQGINTGSIPVRDKKVFIAQLDRVMGFGPVDVGSNPTKHFREDGWVVKGGRL